MNNTKVLMALLTGAAIGAFAGVLFAPAKGSELRNGIAEKAKDIMDMILATAEQIADEAEEISVSGRSSI